MTKRIFDLVLSGILIVLLLPFMLVISIAIYIGYPWIIIYKSERVGKNGEKFGMFKFSTLVRNADNLGGIAVAREDGRTTKVGKFLRRTKLDELPTLFNVFKGDMSFVGPRPEVPFYVEKFTEEEKKILSVPQGITDFSSIRFRNESEILENSGYEDKDKAYEDLIQPEKLKLQLKYVKERNFLLDVKLILITIKSVFK